MNRATCGKFDEVVATHTGIIGVSSSRLQKKDEELFFFLSQSVVFIFPPLWATIWGTHKNSAGFSVGLIKNNAKHRYNESFFSRQSLPALHQVTMWICEPTYCNLLFLLSFIGFRTTFKKKKFNFSPTWKKLSTIYLQFIQFNLFISNPSKLYKNKKNWIWLFLTQRHMLVTFVEALMEPHWLI